MIARYVELVIARPEDESAVRRLLERASAQPAGLDAVVRSIELRREAEGVRIDLALGAIAIARGYETVAREALDRALERDPPPAAGYALYARLVERFGATDTAGAPRTIVSLLRRAAEHAVDAASREGYQRDLAARLVDLHEITEARALYAELSRGGSAVARTEIVRVLVAHGECAAALEEIAAVERSIASDASAGVGLALVRAQCQLQLNDPAGAHATLVAALPLGARSGRAVEVLDALVALARETDGLGTLEHELAERGAVATLHRGIVLEELGREEEALVVLRSVLARSPRDADTRQRVVRLLARNGRMEESLDEQRALARLFPERIALTLELATTLRDQGRADEALEVLDRARARVRRDRTALFLLVEAYSRLGARDRVLATLEAIVRASPDDPRALVALANELLDSRESDDRERALDLVERVARSGDPVVGHVEAARALANLRVFDRAFEHLDEAARLAPESPVVLDAQADLYERANRDEAAEQALQRRIAAALASDDPELRQSGMDAEIRLVASWHRRGLLARMMPELEQRHARGDASAGRMLADAQRRTQDLAGSLATLTQLSERSPDDVRLVTSLARLHHAMGDYDAEVRALSRLAQLEPARAGWHMSRLVELALASYRDEDAIRFAEDASRRAIDDASLFVRLGRLHARRRDPERAAQAYARALEIDPDEHEAAWELAAIERERGNVRRALELQLSILERSRDDELRERAGRAVLETARADGSEAALEPRLLALALAHGDAPVFRRLALALYGSLSSAARARNDEAEVERWVARALPILLAGLRDGDVGTRASARQLLFHHPVPGAAPALLALVTDDGTEPTAKLDALAAALRVVGPHDQAALRSLLASPSETIAALALHGLVRVLSSDPRDSAERARVLAAGRARGGRIADHAWALTLLLGPAQGRDALRDPPRSATAPWLASWHAAVIATEAAPAPSAALLATITRRVSSRTRDDLVQHTVLDLSASGALDDTVLDELARRALGGSDANGHVADRVLTTRARPVLACAPTITRQDTLEAWLARILEACPRDPRDPARVSAALVRAASAVPEAAVPSALMTLAGRAETRGAALEPAATALVARALPVRSASPELARAFVALASVIPSAMPTTAWRDLLAFDDRTVRASAAGRAPPELALDLAVLVAEDPSWTVRRSALVRLATLQPEPEIVERSVSSGLADPAAFVRSAALELARARLDRETLCTRVAAVASDPDPVVAARARALTAEHCVR